MRDGIFRLARVGTLLLACALGIGFAVIAQQSSWDATMAAAAKAYQDRNFPEAQRLYSQALQQAEAFGPADPRLATNLNNLAESYRQGDRFAEAEPLYKRSLEVWERARGPRDVTLSPVLSNLGELYRQMGRYPAAEPLFKRALEIREAAPRRLGAPSRRR